MGKASGKLAAKLCCGALCRLEAAALIKHLNQQPPSCQPRMYVCPAVHGLGGVDIALGRWVAVLKQLRITKSMPMSGVGMQCISDWNPGTPLQGCNHKVASVNQLPSNLKEGMNIVHESINCVEKHLTKHLLPRRQQCKS